MANRRRRKPKGVSTPILAPAAPAAAPAVLADPASQAVGTHSPTQESVFATSKLLPEIPELPHHIEDLLSSLQTDQNPWFRRKLSGFEKQTFVRTLAQVHFDWYTACEIVEVHPYTMKSHVEEDATFAAAIKMAEAADTARLEALSRKQAFQEKNVIERIFNLKARRADRYAENRGNVTAVQVNINDTQIR